MKYEKSRKHHDSAELSVEKSNKLAEAPLISNSSILKDNRSDNMNRNGYLKAVLLNYIKAMKQLAY